jgi:hypothetical protein
MTVTELLAEINDHGFEDTLATRKVAAVNWAIKNIAQRKPWPFLEKVMTLTFSGSNPVPTNVPADLRAVMKIMDLSTGRRVRFKRTDDMEESYAMNLLDAGDPFFYYFEGSQLRIWQVPGASQTLRLRYIRTAPTVADGDPEANIIIPPDYHEAIIFRALFRLYDLEDDPELSQRFEAHYENVLQQMTDALMAQQHDEPEYIHVVDDDDWDY